MKSYTMDSEGIIYINNIIYKMYIKNSNRNHDNKFNVVEKWGRSQIADGTERVDWI